MAGFGMVAHAQPASPDKAQSFEEKRKEKMARLYESLKLTGEQEAAWKDYCAAVKTAKEKLQPAKEKYREKWSKMSEQERAEKKAAKAAKAEELAKLTAIERLERKQAKMPEAADAIGELLAATRVFYAKLTPEQQKTFDAVTLEAYTKKK